MLANSFSLYYNVTYYICWTHGWQTLNGMEKQMRRKLIFGFTIEERDQAFKEVLDYHDTNHRISSDGEGYCFPAGIEKIQKDERMLETFLTVEL
jgi:hypothetical protein